MTARIVMTGGATGIGAACAARMAAREADITILDVAEPVHGIGRFIPCDLSDPAALDKVPDKLPGPWDALVNVAGIPGPTPADQVVAVNFLGMRHLTERMLPRIRAGGSVTTIASTAGRDWMRRAAAVNGLLDTPDFAAGMAWCRDNTGLWDRDPYTFSKQCAVAWTYRGAGLALPYGVRVNSVSPGSTLTRLTGNFTEQIGAAQVAWLDAQVGRAAAPDDIARIIDFVALGDCGWLNGVDIVVDGGLTAGMIGGWIDMAQSPAAIARAAMKRD
ncbi:SDR family oxidoreductase [Emcibacter sp. SYSU 3D8]|uniref:SDR family oxidoreductase n=1 Tax=Emcibacter sp. SYSU 3D8 TaxID=3133969 RepID=UPI0031FEBC8B